MAVVFGLLAAGLNLISCVLMMHTEKKLLCEGWLPRRGILLMKDYNFFMIGDRVLVTLMDFAILYVLVRGWPLSLGAVAVSVLAALVWTAVWHSIWLSPSHRWDSFYPRAGVISLLGKIHLVYFAIQYALGFMGLWMVGYMAAGYRPWSWWAVPLGLFAAGAYFVTLGSDLVHGKFKKLFIQHG